MLLRLLLLIVFPLLMQGEATNISQLKADFPLAKPVNNYLLIVSNDGVIYKFDPVGREMHWHSSLNTNLMSVNMTETEDKGGYFLPNFDGNFLYVSTNHNVMEVQRQDLEKLLGLCFDANQKHFLHQNTQYYILNLDNGNIEPFQDFLKSRKPINKTYNQVIKLEKKYLRSLREDTTENWNIISSHISILTISQFLSTPKIDNRNHSHPYLDFRRISPKNIQIEDRQTKEQYELESQQVFVSLFSFDGLQFIRHPITKSHQQPIFNRHKDSSALALIFNIDCHSERDIAIDDISNTEMCVSSFRILQQTASENGKIQQIQGKFQKSIPKIENSKQLEISATTIMMIVLTMAGVIGYGINIIQKKLTLMSQKIHSVSGLEKRISDVESKLEEGKEQVKEEEKVEKEPNNIYRVREDSEIKHGHMSIFHGTLLNKPCVVYKWSNPIPPSLSTNMQNIYKNGSNKHIKIHYIDVLEDSTMAFVEDGLQTLADIIKKPHNNKNIKLQILKLINELLATSFVIDCLSPQHIVFDKDMTIKYNCLAGQIRLWQSIEHIESKEVNHSSMNFMIASLFYYIHSGGELLYRHTEDEPIEKTVENMILMKKSDTAVKMIDNDMALQNLMDHLIDKVQPPSIKSISEHFYFWDATRKLTFINEFSNYMETFVDDDKLKKFQDFALKNNIIKYPWTQGIDRLVVQELNTYRKYDFYSVRDLIRIIRNKTNHFMQLPENVKTIVGKTKQELCQYFMNKFPKLLCFMFMYSKKKHWKL